MRIKTRAAERELRATAPRVDDADIEALRVKAAAEITRRVFFPTGSRWRAHRSGSSCRRRSSGTRPATPGATSSAVSSAELEERLDFRATLGLGENQPDRLMILPIAPGRRRESFGGGRQDDPLRPPLVEVIVPAGRTQETVLKDYDLQAKRPVRLEAVVPAASAASATRPAR